MERQSLNPFLPPFNGLLSVVAPPGADSGQSVGLWSFYLGTVLVLLLGRRFRPLLPFKSLQWVSVDYVRLANEVWELLIK